MHILIRLVYYNILYELVVCILCILLLSSSSSSTVRSKTDYYMHTDIRTTGVEWCLTDSQLPTWLALSI